MKNICALLLSIVLLRVSTFEVVQVCKQYRRLGLLNKVTAILTSAILVTTSPQPSGASSNNVQDMIEAATLQFKAGKISDSIQTYNEVVKRRPNFKPYLWQRGLALYLNDQYEECDEQFRIDVTVNPADTEEAIWNYMCRAAEFGKPTVIMQLNGKDSRPFMRLAYDVFAGEKNWKELSDLGDLAGRDSLSYFYSRLYLSLYFHANGETDSSLKYIKEALSGGYSKRLGASGPDLMISVAEQYHRKLLANSID